MSANHSRRLAPPLPSLDDAVGLPVLGHLSRLRGGRGVGRVALQVAAEIFDHGPEDLDENAQRRLGALHGLGLALLGAGLHLLGAADHLKQVILLLQVLGDLLHVQIGDPLLLDQLG